MNRNKPSSEIQFQPSLKITDIEAEDISHARIKAESYYESYNIQLRDSLPEELNRYREIAFIATKEKTRIIVTVTEIRTRVDPRLWKRIYKITKNIMIDQDIEQKIDSFRRADLTPDKIAIVWSRVKDGLINIKALILFILAVLGGLGYHSNFFGQKENSAPSPHANQPVIVAQSTPQSLASSPAPALPEKVPVNPVPPPTAPIPPTPTPADGTADSTLEQDVQTYLQAAFLPDVRHLRLTNVRLRLLVPLAYSHDSGIGKCIIDGSIESDQKTLLVSRSFNGSSTVGQTDDDLIKNACQNAIDNMILSYHAQ